MIFRVETFFASGVIWFGFREARLQLMIILWVTGWSEIEKQLGVDEERFCY